MKYFSMFSGVGGFELGIGEAGECVGYSEINPYAIKVYERQFNESCDEHAPVSPKPKPKERPQGRKRATDKHGVQLHAGDEPTPLCNRCKGHTNYGDATKINPKDLPDFDLLVGGFPCQAFSVAGKRAGFNDTRGTLFFDIARILTEKRPRHLLLENVKGLLSHDGGKTFQTIIGILSDLGYRVEWQVLNSKDFGVPQNRERVFIIGHLRGECGREVFPIAGGGSQTQSTVHPTLDANYYKGPSNQRRMINQLNKPKHSNDRVYSEDGLSPTLNTAQGGLRQPFIAPVLTPDRPTKRQNGRRFKENGEPSFTLTGQDKHGVQINSRIRRLTPKECMRLQGFPDNWCDYGADGQPISDTQKYKMAGNAVTVNVVSAVVSNFKCLEVL